MKIGIIVYSQTGNTWSVAQKLETKLAAAGHSATLERITIVGEASPGTPVQFQTLPDVGPYEAIAFGAPVQAFSLATAMKGYLQQIASLQGKQVACFVTKQLPFYWTGGNQALGTMRRICQSKGATVREMGIALWGSKQREQEIANLVNKLSAAFEL